MGSISGVFFHRKPMLIGMLGCIICKFAAFEAIRRRETDMETGYDTTLGRIGERIRTFRKSRGLRMKDLAADLLERQGVQIGESMISRIENGQTELRLGNLHAIAAALNVDVSELLRLPAPDHHPLGVLDDPRLLYRVRQLRALLTDEQIRISLIQFIDLLLLMEDESTKKKPKKDSDDEEDEG